LLVLIEVAPRRDGLDNLAESVGVGPHIVAVGVLAHLVIVQG